jgi:hypothetical protein
MLSDRMGLNLANCNTIQYKIQNRRTMQASELERKRESESTENEYGL